MPWIEHSVDVQAPAALAYGQWTQFERLPRFTRAIREVRRTGERQLHWRADIAGIEEAWDAEVVEDIPDRRIAWRSTGGAINSGVVTFEPLGEDASRMTLSLAYVPRGLAEKVGDLLGLVDRVVRNDLERFKDFLEEERARSPLRATVDELVGQ